MKKFIVDGKVAVLISPGWGAGWSTWNNGSEEMVFDYTIAKMLHEKVNFNEIYDYAEKQYPDAFFSGIESIVIEWLPEGTRFQVREYDGYEHIETYEEQKWLMT